MSNAALAIVHNSIPPMSVYYRPGACIEAAGGVEKMHERNLAALRRQQSLLALLASIRAGFVHVTDMHRAYIGGVHPDGDDAFNQVMAGAQSSLLDWLRARGEDREYRTDVNPFDLVCDLLTRISTEHGAKELLRVATYDAGAARDRKVIDKWTRGAP